MNDCERDQPTACMDKLEEYRPTNQEVLQEYEIRIQFLSRGCAVHVGCKSIAFETTESAMKEVNEYVNNTYETQQKWRKLLD
jgi:hypothetical protein